MLELVPKASAVIWMINQYAGSPRHGMEYRHYYLARALSEQGHTVVVVSGTRSHLFTQPPRVRKRYTSEVIDGVTYCWVAVPDYERAISVRRVFNMAVFALRLTRVPVGRLPAPDAILVSSPSLFPLPVASRWARRLGARLVFEVRDIWPLTLRELGGLSERHPLMALMQRFEDYGYRRADAVVSVLPAAEAHMVSRGMDRRKFHYLPNGVDLKRPPTQSAAPRVQEAIRPGRFTVGFVGTLGRANVLETLIDAARLLGPDEAQIVVVGHGPERDQLVARAPLPGEREVHPGRGRGFVGAARAVRPNGRGRGRARAGRATPHGWDGGPCATPLGSARRSTDTPYLLPACSRGAWGRRLALRG